MDCMIDISGAVRVVKDAAFVIQKWIEVSMKGDGYGPICQSLLKTIGSSVGSDSARDSNHDLICVIGAILILGYIRIRGIWHEAKLLHVSIAVCEQSTVTSIVTVRP